jgi:polysaccharide deacetylase 2 family uncharacterized protein YibQ
MAEDEQQAMTAADARVFAKADELADAVKTRNTIARQVTKATYVAARDGHVTATGASRPQHPSSNLRNATSSAISRGLARQFDVVSQIGSGRFAANLARYLRQAGVLR